LLDDWADIRDNAIKVAKDLGPLAFKYLAKRYLPNL